MTPAVTRDGWNQPELDARVERDLARRARSGDREARSALICSGLRHVVQRARMLGFRGEAFDDAVQCGCLGLIAAVDRFDPDRGARLRTFAWWWIGQAMKAAVPVVESELPEDLPDHRAGEDSREEAVLTDVPEVLRLRYRIGEESGGPRSRREVAAMLGLTEAQVRVRESRAVERLRVRLAKVMHRAPGVVGADPP